MHDDKRQVRLTKRALKKQGTRKRRRFLKDLSADPKDFAFGDQRSEDLNGYDRRATHFRERCDNSD